MGSTEKVKGQEWELSCLLQNQPLQHLSELPGGNSHLCWCLPHPIATLEDEQRCWPWSSSKKSYWFPQCFWGCSVGRQQWCVLWKDDSTSCFLYPESLQSNTVYQVQLITSGIRLASFVEKFSQVCVTLCSEVNQWVYQLSATPTSVASTVLVHGCGKTCHAASAPVSAEVYTCSPSLLLEVYRKKLDCPGQLRWPNSR